MTGKPYIAPGWRLVTRKTKSDYRVRTFSHIPNLWGWEKSWRLSYLPMADGLTNPAYRVELPSKALNNGIWGASGLVNKSMCWEGGAPQIDAPVLRTFLDLSLCTYSSGCSL